MSSETNQLAYELKALESSISLEIGKKEKSGPMETALYPLA